MGDRFGLEHEWHLVECEGCGATNAPNAPACWQCERPIAPAAPVDDRSPAARAAPDAPPRNRPVESGASAPTAERSRGPALGIAAAVAVALVIGAAYAAWTGFGSTAPGAATTRAADAAHDVQTLPPAAPVPSENRALASENRAFPSDKRALPSDERALPSDERALPSENRRPRTEPRARDTPPVAATPPDAAVPKGSATPSACTPAVEAIGLCTRDAPPRRDSP